jgi:hypothetical protein
LRKATAAELSLEMCKSCICTAPMPSTRARIPVPALAASTDAAAPRRPRSTCIQNGVLVEVKAVAEAATVGTVYRATRIELDD